jgi:hypothetical protein
MRSWSFGAQRMCALAHSCAHLGGPLSEGTLEAMLFADGTRRCRSRTGIAATAPGQALHPMPTARSIVPHSSMPITPPPPVLASSRVLEYAVVDDAVTYTGRHTLIVAGQVLGPVPRLAIGSRLTGGEIVLLHCDAEWDVLATAGYASIEAARRAAEDAYSGLNGKWRAISFTDAEVAAFLDDEDRGLICSFCGRHPHEVDRIITGHGGAAICEICIKALREKAR